MSSTLIVVGADDWSALYLDGSKVWENNSIPVFAFQEAIANSDDGVTALREFYLYEDNDAANKWLEEEGRFPDNFNDIPLEFIREL